MFSLCQTSLLEKVLSSEAHWKWIKIACNHIDVEYDSKYKVDFELLKG